MELLTDENKKQFEEWLKNHEAYNYLMYDFSMFLEDDFKFLPFEMQIGVYLAYYDSLGYDIYVKFTNQGYSIYIDSLIQRGHHELTEYIFKSTRNEAYKEALKQVDEIRNKN